MNSGYGELENMGTHVTWSLPNFSDLPWVLNYFVDSSRFELSGATWCLRLFPRGWVGQASETQIWLVRLVSPVLERKYCAVVGFRDRDDQELVLDPVGDNFIDEIDFDGQKLFGCKFDINERRMPSTYYRHDGKKINLMVFCHVFVVGMRGEASHTVIETPRESPSVQKWKSDYKKLLESGAESDLLLVVSGREFRAHKCILRARSPVFDAMFGHDTKEKESGRIVIDDLDPDSFPIFLEHLYTGNVGAFSEENASKLYKAADKYDVPELKSEAVQYMQRHLSLQSFCDVTSLAFQHGEQALMDGVVDFFKNNSLKIFETETWPTFLREKNITANELLSKVHGKK